MIQYSVIPRKGSSYKMIPLKNTLNALKNGEYSATNTNTSVLRVLFDHENNFFNSFYTGIIIFRNHLLGKPANSFRYVINIHA